MKWSTNAKSPVVAAPRAMERPRSSAAYGRASVPAVFSTVSIPAKPASCTMSGERNANAFAGVSFMATWNPPSAISPSPVGAMQLTRGRQRSGGVRAWNSYDNGGDLSRLDPLDVLAPALLDAAIGSATVISMLSTKPSAERDLLVALHGVIEQTPSDACFEDQDLAAETGEWWPVRQSLQASDKVRNVKDARVPKILHRKSRHLCQSSIPSWPRSTTALRVPRGSCGRSCNATCWTRQPNSTLGVPRISDPTVYP